MSKKVTQTKCKQFLWFLLLFLDPELLCELCLITAYFGDIGKRDRTSAQDKNTNTVGCFISTAT